MTYNLQYSRFNHCSILIEWPAIIDDLMLKNILNFKFGIQNYYIKQNIEVISAYNSILIVYPFTIDNINDEFVKLKTLFYQQRKAVVNTASTWEIPVCYADEFAVDLESFSKRIGLSKTEIIERHSRAIYTVYFIGFLPGFLYLGGLDSALFLDRKITPNLNVKKGSVAIGGQQTGIYPQDSPGGWHVIGNSPVELFNPKQQPPCTIKAGDIIKFISITKMEHEAVLNGETPLASPLKARLSNA